MIEVQLLSAGVYDSLGGRLLAPENTSHNDNGSWRLKIATLTEKLEEDRRFVELVQSTK